MVQMSFPGIYGQNLRLRLLASQMQCRKGLLGKNGSFKIAIVDVSEYAQWFFIV